MSTFIFALTWVLSNGCPVAVEGSLVNVPSRSGSSKWPSMLIRFRVSWKWQTLSMRLLLGAIAGSLSQFRHRQRSGRITHPLRASIMRPLRARSNFSVFDASTRAGDKTIISPILGLASARSLRGRAILRSAPVGQYACDRRLPTGGNMPGLWLSHKLQVKTWSLSCSYRLQLS